MGGIVGDDMCKKGSQKKKDVGKATAEGGLELGKEFVGGSDETQFSWEGGRENRVSAARGEVNLGENRRKGRIKKERR